MVSEREGGKMNLNETELTLVLSALEGDRIGKWGDERSENIYRLINKIKREKAGK
jgi:hypothetical protein